MAAGARASYIEIATPVALCLAPQPWRVQNPQGFQDPLDLHASVLPVYPTFIHDSVGQSSKSSDTFCLLRPLILYYPELPL